MVLNKYRSTADKLLNPFANAFSGLHPNTLSAASLLFAILAGMAFIFSNESKIEDILNRGHYTYIMLAIASICIFLNGFLDAIDGKVARLTNRISKRGDFLDHALDRYADIFILGGIMLSPYCDMFIGILAIIAVLMTSYMGTQAQALGCGRNYSGLLGRADRMVILIIAPLIQMGVVYYFPSGMLPFQYISNFTILEYVMLWFIIAGNFTAIHRGVQSWRELRDLESSGRKRKGMQKRTSSYDKIIREKSKFTIPHTKPTRKSTIKKASVERSLVKNKPKIKTKPKPKLKRVTKTKGKAEFGPEMQRGQIQRDKPKLRSMRRNEKQVKHSGRGRGTDFKTTKRQRAPRQLELKENRKRKLKAKGKDDHKIDWD